MYRTCTFIFLWHARKYPYVSVQLVNDRPKDVAVPENDLGDADDKDAEAGAKDDALQAGVPQELPAVGTEYDHRLVGACSLLFA